jgi:DNA polymerase III subunit beta
MKITCFQRDLDYALNVVNRAINPNNTLPVLNNVLISAKENKLYFGATNLEIAISCTIDAEVKNEGSITVPAKLITSYVSLLNDEKVEIQSGENMNLSIDSSSSNTKIKCISSEEFPIIPKIEKENYITVNIDQFISAINQTVFSASVNTSRPVLSGVLLTLEGNKLKMVATDSYRLSEKKVDISSGTITDLECIVPARTMAELGKIIGKSDEKEVRIDISKNQILFSVGGIELISRLIEGKFPDYRKIIPVEEKTKFEVSVEDLSLVLRRVSLFAKENNNSVFLSANEDGKLVVSSEETKVGEEKSSLLIKIQGGANKISLNAQYLLDVLNFINDDKIDIIVNDKESPAVVKPVKYEDYIYIIMPLKV